MKRVFDLILALFVMVVLLIPICMIALLVYFTSKGPAINWSNRVGLNNNNTFITGLSKCIDTGR
jgi:O-antigen biosynthesis protein WbqP